MLRDAKYVLRSARAAARRRKSPGEAVRKTLRTPHSAFQIEAYVGLHSFAREPNAPFGVQALPRSRGALGPAVSRCPWEFQR